MAPLTLTRRLILKISVSRPMPFGSFRCRRAITRRRWVGQAEGKSNPANFRDPFPNNIIPPSLLNPAAQTMLNRYVPRPNAMDMGAMIMDGVPSVVGAGNDSNNYMDQRNQRNFNDQGTLRVDRIFDGGDNLSARYSVGAEHGFT